MIAGTTHTISTASTRKKALNASPKSSRSGVDDPPIWAMHEASALRGEAEVADAPGGGLAGAGMGAGVGMGMGMMMPGMLAGAMQPAQAQAPAAAAAPTVACPACNQPNAAGAKFCSNCGGKIPQPGACPECGAANAPGAKFCSGCGTKMGATSAKCPKCNAEVEAGTKFCSECGNKME